jgi:large subunit ribosomal protein L4
VIADLPKMDSPKTKDLVAWVSALGAEGKVLLLTNGKNENVYLSSRNVPGITVLPFGEESAYDLLWAATVAIERSALEASDAAAADADASEAEEESDV